MHVCRESDGLIVPTKRTNKADGYAWVAESAEGRRSTKERTTSALVPDPEPGKRVTEVVARTTSGKKGQAEAVDSASVSQRAAGRHMNPR
jgi:hypothetical protein